ncbi:MAG TPA: hypothetical protein HPQ00_08875, partial [Magnetococcales bacterium]|nr:hypothetical protein [Magnetococcales bacterium]
QDRQRLVRLTRGTKQRVEKQFLWNLKGERLYRLIFQKGYRSPNP